MERRVAESLLASSWHFLSSLRVFFMVSTSCWVLWRVLSALLFVYENKRQYHRVTMVERFNFPSPSPFSLTLSSLPSLSTSLNSFLCPFLLPSYPPSLPPSLPTSLPFSLLPSPFPSSFPPLSLSPSFPPPSRSISLFHGTLYWLHLRSITKTHKIPEVVFLHFCFRILPSEYHTETLQELLKCPWTDIRQLYLR